MENFKTIDKVLVEIEVLDKPHKRLIKFWLKISKQSLSTDSPSATGPYFHLNSFGFSRRQIGLIYLPFPFPFPIIILCHSFYEPSGDSQGSSDMGFLSSCI